jgi:hypothetical protein
VLLVSLARNLYICCLLPSFVCIYVFALVLFVYTLLFSCALPLGLLSSFWM